jgi:hypothetical protein
MRETIDQKSFGKLPAKQWVLNQGWLVHPLDRLAGGS